MNNQIETDVRVSVLGVLAIWNVIEPQRRSESFRGRCNNKLIIIKTGINRLEVDDERVMNCFEWKQSKLILEPNVEWLTDIVIEVN